MCKGDFSRLSTICLTVFLLAGCGGGGEVTGSGTQSSKKTSKKKTTSQSLDAANLAQLLSKHQGGQTDVLALLQQQDKTVKADIAGLTGCGSNEATKSLPNLMKGQLLFYPAKKPQGVVLISHGFLLQAEVAMADVIAWAQGDNLSVVLVRLTGHRQDNTKTQSMDPNAWKNDLHAGLCVAHQVRQSGGHSHLFVFTHSMSAPLFKVVSHVNPTIDSWNKNYTRAVNIAPAYTLFYEHIDQLENLLSSLPPETQLPLGDLFAGEGAVRQDVPISWLKSVLAIQKEALLLFGDKEQSLTPTLNMPHKDDIVIHHNKTYPERGVRWSLQLQDNHKTPHSPFSKDVWSKARGFFLNKTIPSNATDDPNHKFPTPANQNIINNILKISSVKNLKSLQRKHQMIPHQSMIPQRRPISAF